MSSNSTFLFVGYNVAEIAAAIDQEALPYVLHYTSRLNVLITISCVLIAALLARSATAKPHNVDAPFFKASKLKWMFDAEKLVRESYGKFYDKVYQIKATEGVQVLIPPKLLGEVKSLPEDVLSAKEAVSEAMMTDYTQFSPGHNAELMNTVIRTKLSQNLARLTPRLKDELDNFMTTEFPPCNDWTAVRIQPANLRAIARVCARAFVGSTLNRDESWLDTSINFAVHVFVAVVKLQFFPAWLRPLGQYLVSDLGLIRKDIARAEGMLRPVIEERIRAMEMESGGFEDSSKPDDFVQWLLESLPAEERTDVTIQTKLQLIIGAASIHTTNNLSVDCLLDLAAHPDVQEELRQEVMEVLEGEDGWVKKDSLSRLRKMDSFVKEVQRLSGNVTAFIRKVIKPIDLSDGTHLPPGTKLLTPLAGISHDERFYASPEEFDALRFWRLRQAGDDANRHQFTSTGDMNMHFGAGKHACPGRFFAASVIKMTLAYFLLNYDLRLKDGESRPKSMMVMMSKTPDPKSEILVRKRNPAAQSHANSP